MKKFVFISLMMIWSISCKKKNNSSTTISEKMAVQNCYLYAKNKDTTAVSLTINGTFVSGKMHWNPYEKDGAVGTLKGTIKNDTIVAEYAYMIEGNNQLEEKVFVIKDENLQELFGDMTELNGKMMIKNPKTAVVKNLLTKTSSCTYQFPN